MIRTVEFCPAKKERLESLQQSHLFKKQVIRRLHYLLSLPRNYESGERWPLVLFLHGAGERGKDLEKLKVYGPPQQVEEGRDLPFILVSPQCPLYSWWSHEKDMLGGLLDEIEQTYSVDPDRIYVTGLSMGAIGTWDLAIEQPQRFAAIVPICGRGDAEKVSALKNVPTWVFHGDKDEVVPLKGSQDMVSALQACGGNVRFTIYPGVGHNSWVAAYNEPELYPWLLAQRRGQNS